MNTKKYEALTRLVRACKNNPDNLKHLQHILTKHLGSSALVAVDVAQESGDPIGKVLADSLLLSDDSELLFDIYEKLPTHSIALMEVYLTITKRILELARSNNTMDYALLAETIASHAEALADIGQHQQALVLAQESACLYQRFIALDGNTRSQPEMESFAVFARCLMAVGQKDSAILIQAYLLETFSLKNDKGRIAYANKLLVMSSYQRMQEDYQQAIEYGQKALDILHPLPNNQSEYDYIKHRVNRNLADCYDSADNLLKANSLLKDSLQFIDDLSIRLADAYELELIDTLESLASIASRLGNLENARNYADQAVKRMDVRYQERPEAFATAYSSLLSNIALVELASGELLLAQQKMNQAVDILEPLCEQYPQRFVTSLAAVFNNRVEVLMALNDYKQAIKDAKQCLSLYRSQTGQQANAAMALNTLANTLMQAGDIETALQRIQECVDVYQQLMAENGTYRTDLAITLGTSAAIHEKLGIYSEALEISETALEHWHQGEESAKLANAQTYHHVAKVRLVCLIEMEQYTEAMAWSKSVLQHLRDTPHLSIQTQADTFSVQATLLSVQGESLEAVQMAQMGIHLLRTLDIDHFPSYKVELADSLGNLCFLQAELDQEQALQSAKEAAQLYQELPEDSFTVSMLENIAIVLQNLGSMAQSFDQYELALDSFQKAVFYQQQIIDGDERYRYDFCTLLQLLLNLQVLMEDQEFYTTLNTLRQLLNQLPFDEEINELRQNLKQVEVNFTHGIEKDEP